MNIIEFFFGIFKECFEVINVDFFGLGFTWIEFILAGAILFIIINFVKGVVGVGDAVSFDLTLYALKKQSQISNANREKQITSFVMTEDLDNHTYTMKKSVHHKDTNTTYNYVSRVKKGG